MAEVSPCSTRLPFLAPLRVAYWFWTTCIVFPMPPFIQVVVSPRTMMRSNPSHVHWFSELCTSYSAANIKETTATSPDDCQTLCQENNDCNFFTFNYGGQKCYMKSTLGSRSGPAGETSGPAHCSSGSGWCIGPARTTKDDLHTKALIQKLCIYH